ncbi:hypothetical protein [uncultured Duncaniella sp.]|uniref:hypothetical protein n=1 Tax=uncultured Duncaniella sp. TaxID=2768039 RepID=UPI0025E1919B|nr:hypothetical protein [uncultured Duncaniella sp.]
MRFLSFVIAMFVMLMCTAPAFEADMCALHSVECDCGDGCDDACDSGGCDCCSPFIACTTCSGFVAIAQTVVATPVVIDYAVRIYTPVRRIPEAFISVDTPPPLYC